MKKASEDRLKAYKKHYRHNEASEEAAIHFAGKARAKLKKMWSPFANKSKETKQMAEVFFKLLEHKLKLEERKTPPSEAEVKEALEQLKDVGRVGFFASVSLLPGGAFSLLGLEMLARKLGVRNFTFIPSSFRKKAENHPSENQAGMTEDS
ncbi:MAG: hypothetical protein ACOC01_00175 [Bacteroidales bacterium]